MPKRKAKAVWKGTIKEGKGSLSVESGAVKGQYSYTSRFEEGPGTNPEELIGAAHAGCFSMLLSQLATEAGYTPESIETESEVEIVPGDPSPTISRITLNCTATIPGVEEQEFQEFAKRAKEICPVSKALASVPEIHLQANLKGS